MISTKRLRLVPFGEEHLTAQYVAWLNDPAVVRYSEQRHQQHTEATCRAYWRSFRGTPNFFWALIAKRPSLGHIGTMTAYLDLPNGTADIGILIGQRSAWGQGYGSEAWQAACRWLFATQPIRKITAGTVATNRSMRRIMEKAGMVPDGVRRDQVMIDGRPVDVVQVALFRV